MFEMFSFDSKDLDWQNPERSEESYNLIVERSNELNRLQRLSLEEKITRTQSIIESICNDYNDDEIYLSFSGGKDSTVLSHIVYEMGCKVLLLMTNTRLEFPESLKFAREWSKKINMPLEIILPEKRPMEVWQKYGYPVISKLVADHVERINNGQITKAINDNEDKYMKYAGIHLSGKCCDYLKKEPIKRFLKEHKELKIGLLGTMAEESQMRRLVWIRKGCIYEHHTTGKIANPIIHWTEKDIWDYIQKNDIEISELYTKYGMKRNGCFCCGFGSHIENPNKYQLLYHYNKRLWKNVLDKFGFREVLKQCKINYYPNAKLEDFKESEI